MDEKYPSNFVKELNEKSDNELIDFISLNVPTKRECAKAILDKRVKESLQHLTGVIQENNTKAEKYNLTLSRLTKWILWLTALMTIATIINILIVKKIY